RKLQARTKLARQSTLHGLQTGDGSKTLGLHATYPERTRGPLEPACAPYVGGLCSGPQVRPGTANPWADSNRGRDASAVKRLLREAPTSEDARRLSVRHTRKEARLRGGRRSAQRKPRAGGPARLGAVSEGQARPPGFRRPCLDTRSGSALCARWQKRWQVALSIPNPVRENPAGAGLS